MVVTGRGRLAADHPTAILQPMARAIIRTLLVRAGDPVRKGQVLATLDPTFTAADLASLQARQRSLVAEAARLLAEADATTYVVAPGASTEAALQANLFQQRQREHAARLDSFDQAIAHDAAERTTSLNQRAALAHQVAIAQAIMDLRKTLMQGAVGSRLQYLDAAAILARSAGELQALTDRLTELAHATASHSADRRAFIENWRREVLDTLADRRTTLAETDAAVAKAAHLADLISITAPEDGVVIDVAARAPGSILAKATHC
ncbi:MAG: biotin/lipoyl-binding protein [Rhodospirillales bacterium]